MPSANSATQALRSTFIIGAASGLNILIGLLRAKVVALLLGPTGMGLLGLLSAIMSVASTFAGMGLAGAGVRQLAASAHDEASSTRVRRALWAAHVAFGVLGGLGVWTLREPIARWFLGDPGQAGQVGWLGIGVFLSLISACQNSIQQGYRRITELARISVLGTLLGTSGGLLAISCFGHAGILVSILLLPAGVTAMAAYYGRRLPRSGAARATLRELLPECRAMITMGAALMLTAVMAEATQLVVRSLLTQDLGLKATGHFHAAWAIAMQYVGFVLAAMSADYLPRLTEAIDDQATANTLVAEQAEISLLLAGPVILFMMALAPWIVEFLYSPEFAEAVDVLRWQVLGDILKIAAWPLGFILIAKAKTRLFILTEVLWFACYLVFVWLGLPFIGLKITGIAFFTCYLIYLSVALAIVHRVNGFQHGFGYALLLGALLIAGILTFLAASANPLAGAWVGLPLCAMFGCYSSVRLSRKTEPALAPMKGFRKLTALFCKSIGVRIGSR